MPCYRSRVVGFKREVDDIARPKRQTGTLRRVSIDENMSAVDQCSRLRDALRKAHAKDNIVESALEEAYEALERMRRIEGPGISKQVREIFLLEAIVRKDCGFALAVSQQP